MMISLNAGFLYVCDLNGCVLYFRLGVARWLLHVSGQHGDSRFGGARRQDSTTHHSAVEVLSPEIKQTRDSYSFRIKTPLFIFLSITLLSALIAV